MHSVPGAADVDNTMRAAQTEVSVRIDRLAAAAYGLTTYDLATVLRTALAGTNVGVYRHAGDEYDMMVRYREDQMKTPYALGTIKVTNPLGQQISLSQVASFLRTESPRRFSGATGRTWRPYPRTCRAGRWEPSPRTSKGS